MVTAYKPDVVSATDYSSFGVSLLGRQFNGSTTEYGFNGKWNEVETGYQNYGMRDYSERGRHFTSVDPLTGKYPWYTPYQFSGNKPIKCIDLDGLEEEGNDADYDPIIEPDLKPEDIEENIRRSEQVREEQTRERSSSKISQRFSNVLRSVDRYITSSMEITPSVFGEGETNTYIFDDPIFDLVEKERQEKISEYQAKLKKTTSEDVPTKTQSNASSNSNGKTQIEINKESSVKSEQIVKDDLKSKLKTGEEILDKPRIYIKGGKGEYSNPDFVIYNRKDDKIVAIWDAKDGNAKTSDNQKDLNEKGGVLYGSTRYKIPKNVNRTIQPGSVKVAKTNVNNK